MVLDNTQRPGVWKISMQQWYETNRSSVGDSMLIAGWQTKAMALTTSDLLAGKVKTAEELEDTLIKHMHDLADTDADAPATQP